MSIVPGRITEDMPEEDIDYQENYDTGEQGVDWKEIEGSYEESKED